MKVYVASSFKLIEKVEELTESLEKEGHTITEKWWKRAYRSEGLGLVDTQELKKLFDNLAPDEFYAKPESRASYLLDLQGIERADVFILVADEIPRKYTGANIELGYALASGLLCLSVGVLENSVLYWDVIRCKSIPELLETIEGSPDK